MKEAFFHYYLFPGWKWMHFIIANLSCQPNQRLVFFTFFIIVLMISKAKPIHLRFLSRQKYSQNFIHCLTLVYAMNCMHNLLKWIMAQQKEKVKSPSKCRWKCNFVEKINNNSTHSTSTKVTSSKYSSINRPIESK